MNMPVQMYFKLAAMVRSPNTDTVTIFCIIQADIGFHVVPSMQTGVFHRVFIYIYYKMILFTLGKGCVHPELLCVSSVHVCHMHKSLYHNIESNNLIILSTCVTV